MSLKEQIKQLQEARIEEIIASSVSKIEKLKLLEKEKLFKYAEYIQEEFTDWEVEAVQLEKELAEKQFAEGKSEDGFFYHSKMTDTIFDPSTFEYEKYETVSYASALERMLRNVDESGNVVVITTRGPRIELIKPVNEVIDKVFEFCVTNKYVGYKNDW
jgi:hypothetical protein